jgi:alanine racemase
MMTPPTTHPTKVIIHLDRLTRNLRLLQDEVGGRKLWPAIKANAYGHDAEIVARHLVDLGYDTLCVAHLAEAASLHGAGIRATFVILSAALPDQAEALVGYGFEPVVCTIELVEALADAAEKIGRRVSVHLMVDTGMGRIGIRPGEVTAFIERCGALPGLRVRGLMSHFPRAHEADKAYSEAQIDRFRHVIEATKTCGIEVRHMANSAAILDLPASHFDVVRPGIAMYGLRPSPEITNPLMTALEPILEWTTRITFLKEVPADTGLSYGHAFRTRRKSLIATIPVGYGDGLSRRLSNGLDVLVERTQCPLVGTITMDQSLVDVTALRGRVEPGAEVVLIGRQGEEVVGADEWAEKLGTINYEIVTGISARVPRTAVGSG